MTSQLVNEATYKGWLIRFAKSGGQWSAQLFEPGCADPIAEEVVATFDEGDNILMQRAKAKIDASKETEMLPMPARIREIPGA